MDIRHHGRRSRRINPRATNIEEDSSSVEEVVPVRYDISSYGWDTDAEGLVKRLSRKDIHVPEFQRNYVWKTAEKSRFIESLILGLPIPSIFLSVDPVTKKMNIIDGQQRLFSLRDFFKGSFALQAKDIQPELKGCRYKLPEGRKKGKLLTEADTRTLENALIHAVVIKQDNPDPKDKTEGFEEAIIQIFKRLNTSGKALQAQEVRACVYHGRLNNLLGKLNQNAQWRQIFGSEHIRMKDMEAILRFFALYAGSEKYRAPMPKFLDTYMRVNRGISDDSAEKLENLFIECISLICDSIGSTAFKTGGTFLLSRFDAVMVGLAKRVEKNSISSDEVKVSFDKLLKNEDYQWATDEFVNDTDRVTKRINISIDCFE